jgi:hypothetical protein
VTVVPLNRLQRERQALLKRQAVQILLSLPVDQDEAKQVLDFAMELLCDWMAPRRL